MGLTDIDRQLIGRCLEREPEAWCEFVDRYLGVVYHVVHHTAHMRSVTLRAEEVEDLAADVMATIVDANFKVLRRFRGKSSLASYLAVIARRVIVNKLGRRAIYEKRMTSAPLDAQAAGASPPDVSVELEDEVDRLLEVIDGKDAELVRAIYLEQKSYAEVSRQLQIPENSIGPTLARLKDRLRRAASQGS